YAAVHFPRTCRLVSRALNPGEATEKQDRDHEQREYREDPVHRSPRQIVRCDPGKEVQEWALMRRAAKIQYQIGIDVRTDERSDSKNQLSKGGIEREVLFPTRNPQQRIDGGLQGGHAG